MITKEAIKTEIDNVQEKYLEALYKIIKALESAPPDTLTLSTARDIDGVEWRNFIKETYGCLAENPIERGDQGTFEIRDNFR